MITDCIAPVITEAGVGTIVTLDGRNLLSEGMKFAKTTIQPIITEAGDQYYLKASDGKVKYSITRRLFLTAESAVKTSGGWKLVGDIVVKAKAEAIVIQTLQYVCIVCGKWYIPPKPYATYCSTACFYVNRSDHTKRFRLVNEEMVKLGMVREHWCNLYSLKRIALDSGVEGVVVTDIEGADGTYVNGLLISNQKLLEKHGVTG